MKDSAFEFLISPFFNFSFSALQIPVIVKKSISPFSFAGSLHPPPRLLKTPDAIIAELGLYSYFLLATFGFGLVRIKGTLKECNNVDYDKKEIAPYIHLIRPINAEFRFSVSTVLTESFSYILCGGRRVDTCVDNRLSDLSEV